MLMLLTNEKSTSVAFIIIMIIIFQPEIQIELSMHNCCADPYMYVYIHTLFLHTLFIVRDRLIPLSWQAYASQPPVLEKAPTGRNVDKGGTKLN